MGARSAAGSTVRAAINSCFEYFLSPDGHFGVLKEVCRKEDRRNAEVVCATCGAVYELLDTVGATGQPVARKFRGA